MQKYNLVMTREKNLSFYHIMNIIHTNVLLVLFSKLLILNKKELQDKTNHQLYGIIYRCIFSSIYAFPKYETCLENLKYSYIKQKSCSV